MGNYLRHSAHDRRVAPRLRFFTSVPGGLDGPFDVPPLRAASGEEDMAGVEQASEGENGREVGPRHGLAALY